MKFILLVVLVFISGCVSEPYQEKVTEEDFGYDDRKLDDGFYFVSYSGFGAKSSIKKNWYKRADEICGVDSYMVVRIREFDRFTKSDTVISVFNGVPLAYGENRFVNVSVGNILCDDSSLTVAEAKKKIKVPEECLLCAQKTSINNQVESALDALIKPKLESDLKN